jgi:hypothetical protein
VSHFWPDAQAAQSVPFAPQEPFDSLESDSHVPPDVQQPLHDVPPHVHIPVEHVPPEAQGAHAAPPVPHELLDCDAYGTHWPLALQHPEGHKLWSHVGPVSTGGASGPCTSPPPLPSSPTVPSSPGCPSMPPPLPLPEELLPPEELPPPS